MNSTLNQTLATRAQSAAVDVSPIRNAVTLAQLCTAGGQLVLAAKGNAELAAIQLAMRERAEQLSK
jgi:hypothetical protein